MQDQNPNQPDRNNLNQPGENASPGKMNTNNPAQNTSGEGDDYKRDGVHLGGSASTGEPQDTAASTQKGGGGSGYDVNREQQEVNKEQEEMHQERDQDDLQVERTQTPRPETDPGRENPDTSPQQPETKPGTSTMG